MELILNALKHGALTAGVICAAGWSVSFAIWVFEKLENKGTPLSFAATIFVGAVCIFIMTTVVFYITGGW